MPTPADPGGAAVPWWPAGWWLGPPELGRALCAGLGDVSAWTVGARVPPAGASPPSILLNALALADDAVDDHGPQDVEGAGSDALLRLDPLVRAIGAGGSPGRVLTVIWSSWSGRGGSPRRCGRSALALALSRHWALELAPTGTTVNAVAVPDGFPLAPPSPTAPAQVAVGLEDLAHAVRFFGHPDNSYVIGQLVSLCGGDFIWGNHSA